MFMLTEKFMIFFPDIAQYSMCCILHVLVCQWRTLTMFTVTLILYLKEQVLQTYLGVTLSIPFYNVISVATY